MYLDRIEVYNEDITSQFSSEKLAIADLTIMHNPFEWFAKDKGSKAFKTILSKLKSGGKVISLPSIESQNIDFSKWLENITPEEGPWKDELNEFAMYKVL